MAKSAQVMAEKFQRGLQGAGTAYQEGIRGVTVNPAQKAIAAAPKWEQAIQEAIAEQSYQKGLQGVTLQSWQAASIAATQKLTASAAVAAQNYAKFAAVAAPMQAQFQAEIEAMPDVTPADAEARAVRNIQLQRQLKGIMRGRR